MTIKTTVQQITESSPALVLLTNGRNVPAKVGYSISKLAKACQNEMEHFEERRTKVFTDAGCTLVPKKDAEGAPLKDPKSGQPIMEWVHPEDKAKVDAAVKEVEDMRGAETELNALLLPHPLGAEYGKAEFDGAPFYGLDWALKPEPPQE
jgi:hypothetical protein